MTKSPRQWDQDLPPWVQAEAVKPKRPTPKNMPPRKPSALAPKPAPKPKEPETPQLHVRVVFQGSITFCLEGEQAKELRELLAFPQDADKIVEHLDPWASGASIRQTIDILEDPSTAGGTYHSWAVSEEQGTVNAKMNRGEWGPFSYTIEGGDKPQAVGWDRVSMGGAATWPVTIPASGVYTWQVIPG